MIVVSHEKRKEDVEDSSDSDLVLLSPRKRKQSALLTRSAESRSAGSSQEEVDADLREDIADLQDTGKHTPKNLKTC